MATGGSFRSGLLAPSSGRIRRRVTRPKGAEPRQFGWLRTVAIHEAYRLAEKGRRDAALEELAEADSMVDGWEALLPAETDLEEHLEARRALSVLARLPERQRRYLALRVAGYRYDEIADAAGVTYTNVNKHLARAREAA